MLCFGNSFVTGFNIKFDSLGTPSILVTNFLVKSPTKSPISNHQFFCFKVIKMCCMIQLWLRVRNVYRNWIIQHILMTWNRKIGDLKLVTWLVTSPKNWWLEWMARLKVDVKIKIAESNGFWSKEGCMRCLATLCYRFLTSNLIV